MTTDLIRATLAAGLAWLYDTVQPDGAIESHHGPMHPASDRLRLEFAPLPKPVIIVESVALVRREVIVEPDGTTILRPWQQVRPGKAVSDSDQEGSTTRA